MIEGTYLVHGRCVRIGPANDHEAVADIRMRLSGRPALARLDEGRFRSVVDQPKLHVRVEATGAGDRYWLRFFGRTVTTDCFIEPGGAEVRVDSPPGRAEGLLELLLGPILGWCLRLSGAICVHAGAAIVGRGACLFLGHSGAGKSTLVAALAERGHTLLADEFATIEHSGGIALVPSGTRAVRLFPRSAAALTPEKWADLGPLWSGSKRRLAPVLKPAPAPARLHAIYLLERCRPAEPVQIERLPGAAGLVALAGQLYPALMPRSQARQAADLARLADIVTGLPVLTFRIPDDLRRLGEVCERLADRNGLSG